MSQKTRRRYELSGRLCTCKISVVIHFIRISYRERSDSLKKYIP